MPKAVHRLRSTSCGASRFLGSREASARRVTSTRKLAGVALGDERPEMAGRLPRVPDVAVGKERHMLEGLLGLLPDHQNARRTKKSGRVRQGALDGRRCLGGAIRAGPGHELGQPPPAAFPIGST